MIPSDPGDTAKRFGWRKTLTYSLIPTCVVLLALELAARFVELWIPPYRADLGLGFTPESRAFVLANNDPEMMVTNPAKIGVVFPDQRFPRKKPPGTMRIIALGGSSVHYLQSQFTALAERLAKELAHRCRVVEIINCGGHAYGSDRLVLVAVEALKYEPDLVLIYSGHNEFEELEQFTFADLNALPLQRLVAKSAICRFIRDRMADYKIHALRRRHRNRIMDGSTKPWKLDLTPREKAERMHEYRNNLSHIIEMCRAQGVPVIIGTVASSLWRPRLHEQPDAQRYEEVKRLFAEGRYEEGVVLGRRILRTADRRQASDEENDIIRALARKYGLPLADVESAVAAAEPHHVLGETLFRDECHLTEEGNAILIARFESTIVDLFR